MAPGSRPPANRIGFLAAALSAPGLATITFVAGSIAGMALMFSSIDYRVDPYYGDQIRYGSMFYTGVGLFVSSIITGAVLAAQNDEASVNVYPVE